MTHCPSIWRGSIDPSMLENPKCFDEKTAYFNVAFWGKNKENEKTLDLFVMAAGSFFDIHSGLSFQACKYFPFFLVFLFFSCRKAKLPDYRDIPFSWLTVALLLEVHLYVNRFGADDWSCPWSEMSLKYIRIIKRYETTEIIVKQIVIEKVLHDCLSEKLMPVRKSKYLWN